MNPVSVTKRHPKITAGTPRGPRPGGVGLDGQEKGEGPLVCGGRAQVVHQRTGTLQHKQLNLQLFSFCDCECLNFKPIDRHDKITRFCSKMNHQHFIFYISNGNTSPPRHFFSNHNIKS